MEPPRINLTSDLPISQRAYRTSTTSEAEINKLVQNLLGADAEPLPRIDSLLDKLNSAKYFSTLDLASGYWHIPLHDKDKEKLAFVTPEGYEIKEGCITSDNQNIETIKKLQPPKNVKQLQSFLGSVNVYNKFIDSYAKIREPLNQLLKKDKQWDWTAECQTAFELLKNKLITKPVLQLYNPKLPLHVFCDASLKAIGAILKQPDNSGTLLTQYLFILELYTVPPTDQPFEYISVDTVGGFNYYNSSTKNILHLTIDHAARYVWAFTSKSETTETYANCLKQLFQIQISSKLLTDRNGAFTSSRFKRFLRNYNVKQLLTTHHPQTNGKCERVNQSIVTKLRCKVNSSPTKIPWTKFLEQVINEYNLNTSFSHKIPSCIFVIGHFTIYISISSKNQVYPPVEEARKLAKENTLKYHEKNKIKYDARFIDSPFEPGDLVIYEEFNYPN
ncbi:transposon Tf2-6 polyprotein [Trichonephila clavipes]|nr:transposon Tf2-6 polyprotein [Trichonephila clavipes]